MRKVLITGITGFAGSHLAQLLSTDGETEVAGLDIVAPGNWFQALFAGDTPQVYTCDLTDPEQVDVVMRKLMPDAVVHLAAHAQVAGAWEKAAEIWETNVSGTQTLMQAVHTVVPEARVLLVSSSEVYGKVSPEEIPVSEQNELRPSNPYSASKVGQEYAARQYYYAFGAPVITARPFNHIGPRQRGNFVAPAFARQIAEIEAGKTEPVLRVGNLESERDFTDVRDVVRAYSLLLGEGKAGEVYNIASGTPHRISDILESLLSLSSAEPKIESIPELMRPSDTPVVAGDATRLKTLGGWSAEISLQQSLSDTLDFWRQQVAIEAN